MLKVETLVIGRITSTEETMIDGVRAGLVKAWMERGLCWQGKPC